MSLNPTHVIKVVSVETEDDDIKIVIVEVVLLKCVLKTVPTDLI